MGAFLGARVAAFGEDRAAGGFGGFASRRGYAVTCGRLYGGVLLTVAAAGVFLSVVGATEVGLRVFVSVPVVAAVSAALGCRDWRLVPSVAAPLLAAGRVAVGVGVRPLERLGGGQWLLKGSGISCKLPLIHGAASHHLKRNCLPLTQQPAGFNPLIWGGCCGVCGYGVASVVCCGSRRRCVSVVVSSCVLWLVEAP